MPLVTVNGTPIPIEPESYGVDEEYPAQVIRGVGGGAMSPVTDRRPYRPLARLRTPFRERATTRALEALFWLPGYELAGDNVGGTFQARTRRTTFVNHPTVTRLARLDVEIELTPQGEPE